MEDPCLTVVGTQELTGSFPVEHTIMYTIKFEREAMVTVVPVEKYYTYNGIYISKEFTIELHRKCQGIRHIGVGGFHHNGVSNVAIKNVVITCRTMMINAALRWPDDSEKSLWPMDMVIYVQLQNHTTHISSGMYPDEVWTRSKSSHSVLQNAHPWGCPAYVL